MSILASAYEDGRRCRTRSCAACSPATMTPRLTIPRALLFLPLFAILAGCYMYDYDYNVTPSFTGKHGKTTVAVVGVDDRNRESPGRFKPEYVGLFRDLMFAIPYFVHNKDKKPIADTLANDVALGLTQSGYRATSVPNPSIESPQSALSAARQSSPSRILLVRVFKFESDSQIRTEFGYDITFEVYDDKGRLLASNRVQELKMYGPSYPSAVFARKNLPVTIRKALAEGVSPLMKDV
jgi:hypothetical protein